MFIFTQKKSYSYRLSEVHMMSFIIITRCWSDKLKTISLWYYTYKVKIRNRPTIHQYIYIGKAKIKNFRTSCIFPAVRYRFNVYVQIHDFFFLSKSIDELTHIILTAFSHIKQPTRVFRKLYRLATIQRRLVFRMIQCIIRLIVSCFGEIKQQRVRNNIILLECVLRFFRVVIQRTVDKTIISILL